MLDLGKLSSTKWSHHKVHISSRLSGSITRSSSAGICPVFIFSSLGVLLHYVKTVDLSLLWFQRELCEIGRFQVMPCRLGLNTDRKFENLKNQSSAARLRLTLVALGHISITPLLQTCSSMSTVPTPSAEEDRVTWSKAPEQLLIDHTVEIHFPNITFVTFRWFVETSETFL